MNTNRETDCYGLGEFWGRLNAFWAVKSPSSVNVFAFGSALLIGVVDYFTGPEIAFSVFYLLPIMLAAWFAGKRSGILLAVFSSLIWLLADLSAASTFSRPASALWIPFWNSFVRLCIFAVVAFFTAESKASQDNLENDAREKAERLADEMMKRRKAESEISEISHQEQERIGRDLHDGLGQCLAGIAFKAKSLAEALAAEYSPHTPEAERLARLLTDASQQAGNIARVILLDTVEKSGLGVALSQMAHDVSNLLNVSCTAKISPLLPGLNHTQSVHLYRIAQEAINNAIRHGHADRVELQLEVEDSSVVMRIRDNGTGIATNHKSKQGLGLRIMRHRSGALGGEFNITSERHRGCTVRCTIPLNVISEVSPIVPDHSLCLQSSQ